MGPLRTRPMAQLKQCGPSGPPRPRGAISASLEASLPRPSATPRTSASLEGSEPTLGQQTTSTSLEGSEPTLGEMDQLRLARSHPSTDRTKWPTARPSAIWGH